jgi:hypothetical protein
VEPPVTEGPFTGFAEFAITSKPLAKNARTARGYAFAREKLEGP